MSTVGIVTNNGMYPIAFSLVEAECRDGWNWFLEVLKDDLGLTKNSPITWILDKQKGLKQAL